MKIYGSVKDWSPLGEPRQSPKNRDISPDLKDHPLPSCVEQVELALPGITSCTKELPECRKKDGVKVQVIPQDPLISEPEVIEIDQKLIGKELIGDRFYVKDDRIPLAIADMEGNYLFPISDPHFDQVNAFVHCTKTLNMLERFTGHAVPWRSGAEALVIMPHVEDSDNSYYNHQKGSLEFNCFDSSAIDRTVKSSLSADTISHEVAHAFIDGQRPGYLQNWDDETMAFHEAFADITTLLYVLEYDSNIREIIRETGGNLRLPNRMAQRSEEIGLAKHLSNSDPGDDDKAYLRTAINDFTYKTPQELPWGAGDEELAAEYHSFSRLFSGAFYECFYMLYEKKLRELCRLPDGNERAATDTDMIKAIRSSQEGLGSILGQSLDSLPERKVTFREVALAMIQTDNLLYNGADRELIQNVFVKRGIIGEGDCTD